MFKKIILLVGLASLSLAVDDTCSGYIDIRSNNNTIDRYNVACYKGSLYSVGNDKLLNPIGFVCKCDPKAGLQVLEDTDGSDVDYN